MTMMLRALLPLLLLWTAALQAAPAFPTLSGRVVDEAALMSRKQAHQLTQQLAAFEKRSGIQLVPATSDAEDDGHVPTDPPSPPRKRPALKRIK